MGIIFLGIKQLLSPNNMTAREEEFHREEEGVRFAVQPKLFGKWAYDNVKSSELSLVEYLSVSNVKSQVFTPYTAGKYQKKRFQKVSCPITENSPISSWLVTTDKMVRNNKLSESSSKPLRSSTFLLETTHSKSCSRPSFKVVPEKTQPELVQVVPSEDKLLMSLHSEESTKPSTSSAKDQESLLSEASSQ